MSSDEQSGRIDRERSRPRRLFFFCNAGWFFISHRLSLARAALEQGFEAHLLCDVDDAAEAKTIEQTGLRFHRIRVSRGGLNPFVDAATFLSVLRLLLHYRPTILHNITIKPVLYGSIAARIARLPGIVNAISGLGYIFIDRDRASIARWLALKMYRLALRSPRVRVIFQNPDDMQQLEQLGLVQRRQCVLIAGSGVDLTSFQPTPEPAERPVRIVLPARMLADKGVREYAAAARELKRAGMNAEFMLAGRVDTSNPAALSVGEIRRLEAEDGVRWLGHIDDMPGLLESVHIVCLPSYREGLPKALIEACAAGRPVVTTDVPGCRDVVRNGVNGLVVPARDSESLKNALARLIEDSSLRVAMGARARRIAEREYDVEHVIQRTLDVYASFKHAGL